MDHGHAHPSTPSTLPRSAHGLRGEHAATPPSRQQRLLQTRNAKFPAKKLSLSGISARFSDLIRNEGKPVSHAPSVRNQENIVYKRHREHGSSQASLGILEEITNSIGAATRQSLKRPPIPIFQDSPERALLDESPWVSPAAYGENSSLPGSPPPFDHIRDSLPTMGLREISGNARKSSTPESSPWPASGRNSRRRKSSQKSRHQEEYIEHLEKEIEMVKDAVYSPNSNRPWKEKLKTAKAENERLREQILGMKTAFEAEVQKTVEHMTGTEVDLRRKIRSLEEELEQKEYNIRELEVQHDERRLDQSTVDALKNTIERLEQEKANLTQDNDSMSKRNEVLTQLLAISPTKLKSSFELSSPGRARRNPRPQSLLIPRIPSSPGPRIRSRPQSVVASPDLSATSYFSSHQLADVALAAYNTDTIRPIRGNISIDSGLGESCSVPSTSRIGSRRSTIASQASMSPTAWELPLPTSTMVEPTRQPSKRRARRFMHGSTQLKPLLLPTLTGENGALNVNSPLTSPQRTQLRDFSEESIDTTKMFLSQSPTQYELDIHSTRSISALPLDQELRENQFQSFESAFDPASDPHEALVDVELTMMPDWSPAVVSAQLERLENIDLNSLKSPNSDYINAWMSSPFSVHEADKTILPNDPVESPEFALRATTISRKLSGCHATDEVVLRVNRSPEDTSSVEVPQPLFSPSVRRSVDPNMSRRRQTRPTSRDARVQFEVASLLTPPQVSRKRRKISSSSLLLDDDEGLKLQTLTQQDNFRPVPLLLPPKKTSEHDSERTRDTSRSSSRSSSISLRSQLAKSPLEVLQQRGIARPLATVTIKTIYGTISRYTAYIREIRKDPLAVARRVLANAWQLNWGIMGKLSWWVLGLFLGSSQRAPTSFDWEEYDAENIAERQAENQRLLTMTPASGRRVHFEEQYESYRTKGSKSATEPALKRKKLGWGQTLLLWGKFSVAIMLAVGGAVVQGPAEMLRDADGIASSPRKKAPRVRMACQDDHAMINSSSSPSQQGNFGLGADDNDDTVADFDAPHSKFRRKNSMSPPPNARTLLQAPELEDLPSPLARDSPSPTPYQFGTGSNEIFTFEPPSTDTDWGDCGGNVTIKPRSRGRGSLDSLFDSSPPRLITGGGSQEYDPESAPFSGFDSVHSVESED